jgi:UDP-N-acetylmuramoyl-tripeptide--D-alanyl-D-alanine ligase
MQTIQLSTGAIAINDAYNANPSSMHASISSLLQSYPDKKIILVLSDMLELGENSSQYHAELGKFIDSLEQIQSVYLIGDQIINTKNEIKSKDVRYFISKHMLLEELEKNCTTQDNVIFIKASRGMKLNTIFDELISIDKIKSKNKIQG